MQTSWQESSPKILLALCLQSSKKHKADVKKCYDRIKKLSEQDQQSILQSKVKFKKVMFSEMPSDFVYFKQYNITAKQMYENLLASHTVDLSN